MADTTAPRPIDAVQTFVATVPGLSLKEAVDKFQGHKTLRTLSAARRIAAKTVRVKIPRNLLRQFFIACGGFDFSQLKNGWVNFDPIVTGWGSSVFQVPFGDLRLYFDTDGRNGRAVYFGFRGRRCAHCFSFKDWDKVRGLFSSLGTDVSGQPIAEK